MGELIERRLEDVALQRMAESPVVLVQGPRTVGKSTLLRALARRHGRRVTDLDDPGVRSAAADDPGMFATGPAPVFIDEYQHVPEVLDSIKAELNRDDSPGRFVLAGSTRFEALPLAAQSLTGRLHRMDILPLSQGEIRSYRETLLEKLFDDPAALVDPTPSNTTRQEYARCITTGGFPLALRRSEAARDRWFDDYSALCLERDLLEAGRVRRPAALALLLPRLAAQTAQVLNMSHAARAAELPVSTTADYVRLLESSFLVRLLPAWGRTLLASTAARPKVHMVDSGLAARLLRLSPGKLTGIDPAALQQFGHLLETFAVGEILKQASWLPYRPHIGHWRSHDGFEVDIVAESSRDGSVIGIEVKAGSRVHARDRRGLRKLRDTLGERFTLGVVLHTGPHSVQYRHATDERIIALPADRLWTPTPADTSAPRHPL